MPPNCVALVAVAALAAFVALAAFAAFVALVAEATVPDTLLPDTELICTSCTQPEQALDSASAADAFALRTAYGVAVTGCRGVSSVNDPAPLGRALISKKRLAPEKLFVPKSKLTVKTPL